MHKQSFLASLRVGFFLAVKDIQRSNKWTTLLIIFIMMLTFLNLIVVRGILIGLIEGSKTAYRGNYSGDILLITPRDKNYIEQTPTVQRVIASLPSLQAFSVRYTVPAQIESGYREQVRVSDALEAASTLVTGINPDDENAVTGMKNGLLEGEFLEHGDTDKVLIGKNLLFQYASFDSPTDRTLKNIEIGDKIRLVVNGNVREVTVKGFLGTKVQTIDSRVFMTDVQVRQLAGRTDLNANEIAIKLKPGSSDAASKNYLVANGAGATALVETADESLPSTVLDIQETFEILGDAIGSIALIVAAITIFIVIFVNAITRRKYIGIMKGIGISARAIEISYVFQALFFAIIGIAIATFLILAFIKPYFTANPINFPFSDGILVATVDDVLMRGGLLMMATGIAGFLPAWLVIRQNTLDAILGR